jgi:GR25 family glycosyltransferase involved in LPS biosynthesis
MRIAIIDPAQHCVGLKLIFPDADYYSISPNSFFKHLQYSNDEFNSIYGFSYLENIENISDSNYDIFIIIFITQVGCDGRENPGGADRMINILRNIVSTNKFKNVLYFDNCDAEYDPAPMFGNEYNVTAYFKRNYSKEVSYSKNVYSFPFMIFGKPTCILWQLLKSKNNYYNISQKVIHSVFFSGSIYTNDFTDRTTIYNIIQPYINTYNGMPNNEFLEAMSRHTMALDLNGCGNPNRRTFEILLTNTLLLSQKNNLVWPFEELFDENTIFETGNEFINKLSILMSNFDNYIKAYIRQQQIYDKYFNKEWLYQYIISKLQQSISSKYLLLCNVTSDINEHLPTLKRFADSCIHITECGVRGCVSTYAFADSLKNKQNNKLILVDIATHNNIPECLKICQNENINIIFNQQSDLECPLEETDLLFIDTWHIYGHLKRELTRWHTYVKKYIIMHDTTVDEFIGESVRGGQDIEQLSKDSGIPEDEIRKGLSPAIEEFLQINKNWKIKERYINNNGLTILEKIQQPQLKYYLIHGIDTSRKAFMINQFEEFGISNNDVTWIEHPNKNELPYEYAREICSNLNLTPGQISCTIKHYIALKDIVENKYPIAIIMEDNVAFKSNVPTKILEYLKQLPEDWDVLFDSDWKDFTETEVISGKIVYKKSNEITDKCHGGSRLANFILINQKAAQIMYNNFLPFDHVSDWYYNNLLRKFNLNSYWSQPANTYHVNRPSTT